MIAEPGSSSISRSMTPCSSTAGGWLQCHTLEIGGNLFAVQVLEALRLRRQRLRDDLRCHLGTRDGDCGPFEQKGIVPGSSLLWVATLGLPQDLEMCFLTSRGCQRGGLFQLRLESIEIGAQRCRSREAESHPWCGASPLQCHGAVGIGGTVEGKIPGHEQDIVVAKPRLRLELRQQGPADRRPGFRHRAGRATSEPEPAARQRPRHERRAEETADRGRGRQFGRLVQR